MAKKKAAAAPEGPAAVRTRPIPTEDEVVRALRGESSHPDRPKESNSAKSTTTVYYLAMMFGAGAFVLLALLMRDPEFLRKKLTRKLPWQNLVLDRVAALFGSLIAFLVTAVILAPRQLLRVCRDSYRAQRQELLVAYKEGWKHRRQIGFQYLVLFTVLIAAAVAWRLVIVMTQCEAPIVVVLSGSMETAFYRGDLLFLTNYQDDPIVPGEIVVFKIDGRDIPIVHRVMQTHVTENGTYSFLTKGDNNQGNDRSLYAPGQVWLERRNIIGRAKFFLPYVGMLTVKLNEYPMIKMLVILGMLGMMLYSREL